MGITMAIVFSSQLVVPASIVALLSAVYLVRHTERMVRARYQTTLGSTAFGMVATACLILPTLWYAVFYERCNGPGREVIHMLCVGGLSVSAVIFALVNFSTMRRTDAVLCTVAQVLLALAVLAVGSVPPLLWDVYQDARHWRWDPCPSRRP